VRSEARGASQTLRRASSPAAEDARLGLLGDRDLDVQESALVALGRRKLAPDALARISESVTGGRVDRRLDPSLVSLLAAQPRTPAITQALDYLLARSEGDPSLAGRIRGLLC
jgi:hypothetical protein